MSRVNRSLAAAAVIGAGVLTDVVAHTASGHTRIVYAPGVHTAPVPAPRTHRASSGATPASSGAAPASASTPPASAPPASVSAPPVVVSGGS